jgi:hypothetical protein
MHLFLFNDQLIVASAYRDKFKTFRKLTINEHFHVVDEVCSPARTDLTPCAATADATVGPVERAARGGSQLHG